MTTTMYPSEDVQDEYGNRTRPFLCQICTRGFIRQEHLKRHIRSHTNEKPFLCIFCGRCFARRDLVLRHQHKLHATLIGTSEHHDLLSQFHNDENIIEKIEATKHVIQIEGNKQPILPTPGNPMAQSQSELKKAKKLAEREAKKLNKLQKKQAKLNLKTHNNKSTSRAGSNRSVSNSNSEATVHSSISDLPSLDGKIAENISTQKESYQNHHPQRRQRHASFSAASAFTYKQQNEIPTGDDVQNDLELMSGVPHQVGFSTPQISATDLVERAHENGIENIPFLSLDSTAMKSSTNVRELFLNIDKGNEITKNTGKLIDTPDSPHSKNSSRDTHDKNLEAFDNIPFLADFLTMSANVGGTGGFLSSTNLAGMNDTNDNANNNSIGNHNSNLKRTDSKFDINVMSNLDYFQYDENLLNLSSNNTNSSATSSVNSRDNSRRTSSSQIGPTQIAKHETSDDHFLNRNNHGLYYNAHNSHDTHFDNDINDANNQNAAQYPHLQRVHTNPEQVFSKFMTHNPFESEINKHVDSQHFNDIGFANVRDHTYPVENIPQTYQDNVSKRSHAANSSQSPYAVPRGSHPLANTPTTRSPSQAHSPYVNNNQAYQQYPDGYNSGISVHHPDIQRNMQPPIHNGVQMVTNQNMHNVNDHLMGARTPNQSNIITNQGGNTPVLSQGDVRVSRQNSIQYMSSHSNSRSSSGSEMNVPRDTRVNSISQSQINPRSNTPSVNHGMVTPRNPKHESIISINGLQNHEDGHLSINFSPSYPSKGQLTPKHVAFNSPVQQHIQHPNQHPGQYPGQQVQHHVQHAVQQTMQQHIPYPAHQPVPQSVPSPMQHPTQQPVVHQPAPSPMQHPVQQPVVHQSVPSPMQHPTQQPVVHQSVPSPMQHPAQQPTVHQPPHHSHLPPHIPSHISSQAQSRSPSVSHGSLHSQTGHGSIVGSPVSASHSPSLPHNHTPLANHPHHVMGAAANESNELMNLFQARQMDIYNKHVEVSGFAKVLSTTNLHDAFHKNMAQREKLVDDFNFEDGHPTITIFTDHYREDILQLNKLRSDQFPTTDELNKYINLYHDEFHKFFPFVHLHSLIPTLENYPFLLSIAMIGALYSFHSIHSVLLSNIAWYQIKELLDKQHNDYSITPLWAIQSIVLLTFIGIFSNDINVTKSMKVQLVTLVQLVRLTHLNEPLENFISPPIASDHYLQYQNDPRALQEMKNSYHSKVQFEKDFQYFIKAQIRIRTCHVILIISNFFSSLTGIECSFHSLDLKCGLPCYKEVLFHAPNSQVWSANLDKFKIELDSKFSLIELSNGNGTYDNCLMYLSNGSDFYSDNAKISFKTLLSLLVSIHEKISIERTACEPDHGHRHHHGHTNHHDVVSSRQDSFFRWKMNSIPIISSMLKHWEMLFVKNGGIFKPNSDTMETLNAYPSLRLIIPMYHLVKVRESVNIGPIMKKIWKHDWHGMNHRMSQFYYDWETLREASEHSLHILEFWIDAVSLLEYDPKKVTITTPVFSTSCIVSSIMVLSEYLHVMEMALNKNKNKKKHDKHRRHNHHLNVADSISASQLQISDKVLWTKIYHLLDRIETYLRQKGVRSSGKRRNAGLDIDKMTMSEIRNLISGTGMSQCVLYIGVDILSACPVWSVGILFAQALQSRAQALEQI